MNCKNCNSERIMTVDGKTSDMCYVEVDGFTHDGYVPSGINIGSGDYIKLALCLDCGTVQGEFPVTKEKVSEVFAA